MSNFYEMSIEDKEVYIHDRVSKLESFKDFPNDYWILGVRNKDRIFNKYNDLFYFMRTYEDIGSIIVGTTVGTTLPGKYAIQSFEKYNAKGCAVMKDEEIYYDLWKQGLHHQKMKALVQDGFCQYTRDNNKDDVVDQVGRIYEGNIKLNFHTDTYGAERESMAINGWSAGCQVACDTAMYKTFLSFLGNQKKVSYCLIGE